MLDQTIFGVPTLYALAAVAVLFLLLVLSVLVRRRRERRARLDAAFAASLLEPLIAVDGKLRFLRCNALAEAAFPELENAERGKRIGGVSPALELLLTGVKSADVTAEGRTYRPRTVSLAGNRELLLKLADVTGERAYRELTEHCRGEVEREVARRTSLLVDLETQITRGFADIAERRGAQTDGHVARTSMTVDLITASLLSHGAFPDELTPAYAAYLRMSAPIHDVGKLRLSRELLSRTDPLTPEEKAEVQRHTVYGAEVLDEQLSSVLDREYLKIARDVVLHHHEKWNGRGYPEGLAGEKIPLCARIMAIADVFDALISARPYKLPFSPEIAFEIIQSERGESFDPVVTDCFLSLRDAVTERVVPLLPPPGVEALEPPRRVVRIGEGA